MQVNNCRRAKYFLIPYFQGGDHMDRVIRFEVVDKDGVFVSHRNVLTSAENVTVLISGCKEDRIRILLKGLDGALTPVQQDEMKWKEAFMKEKKYTYVDVDRM